MDVFISYSSRDKEWVRGELLTRIEQAGLKAFIDYRDFIRGAPSISECERGVVESRKTLLVLTPNYIESEWGEIENVMAQTLSPANRDLRIIPLLKADCKKPIRIAALTHIDFTEDADQELAWRQLLTALGAAPALGFHDKKRRAADAPMVLALVRKIQDQSVLLSTSISEALDFAHKLGNRELTEFCRRELVGYPGQTASEVEKLRHRHVTMYCSGAQINPRHLGWAGDPGVMFTFIQSNPDIFVEKVTVFPDPVRTLESRSARAGTSNFLRLIPNSLTNCSFCSSWG
jgi:hypothetical protein